MEDKVRTIRICKSEKCIEVQTKSKKKYYLRPKFKNYLDIVQKVAEWQLAHNKPIGAYDLLQIFSENREHVGKLEPYQRRKYSWPRCVNSIHAYWAQKFILEDYWKVTDRHGKTFSDETNNKILLAVFRHSGSKERTVYWLGDIPEVHIEFEGDYSSVIAPLGTTGLSAIPYEDKDHNATTEWKRLCQYCNNLLEYLLSRLKHKYAPELYVPRQGIEGQFSDFLKSQQNLFLILGKSGTGKTNLVCHLARANSFPVLLLSGEFYPAQGFSLRNEIEEGLKPFGSCSSSAMDIMSRVNYLAEKNHTSFLICLDALNEFANPVSVFQDMALLVSRYGAIYRSIKFCVTCRTPTWDYLTLNMRLSLPQHGIYNSSPSRPATFPPALGRFPSTILGDFSEEEMADAVETYRRQADFKGKLTGEVEELCRCPLLLRLVSQTWAGRELPQRVNVRELWDAFWNATVRTGPSGSESFALQIASEFLRKRITEITKTQTSCLPGYSEERLAHLVAVRFLTLRPHKYEDVVSFGHEQLLEYAIARSLMSSEGDVINKILTYLERSEAFSPLQGSICFLSEMMDDSFRWKLLHRLIAANDDGKRLACQLVKELRLASSEAWEVLEAISNEVPLDVVSAVGEIGNSQPERTIQLLMKTIDANRYWSCSCASLFATSLTRLCEQSKFFIRIAEKFLHKGSRYKQISLMTLSRIRDYAGWPRLEREIAASSRSRDEIMREVVAFVLGELAQHNSKAAKCLLMQMAQDVKKYVRYQVSSYLSELIVKGPEGLKIATSLDRNKDWRAREVASRAVGLAIRKSDSSLLYALAEKFANDHKEEVRSSLVEGIVIFVAFEKRLKSIAVPLIEKVILRSTRSGIKNLSFHLGGVSAGSLSAELMPIWFRSENPKLREFTARIWRGGLGTVGIDSAWCFATDPSDVVRVSFAERLEDGHFWIDEDDAPRTFAVVKKLLCDQNSQVRVAACRALCEFAEHERDECVLLFMDKMTSDIDEKVKRVSMGALLVLDAEKEPSVRIAIDKYISDLRCDGELTKLAMDLGEFATKNEVTFDFLCEMAQKQSESHQHIVTSALWMAWIVDDVKKVGRYIGILSQVIRRYPFHSHFMAFAWVIMDLDEERIDERYRNNLVHFVELFEAGYESGSMAVRVWTTLASWYCFVLYPNFLRECVKVILKKAVCDSEWRVRFACALYGGVLIADKPNKVNPPIFDFVGDLCSSLLQDNDDLVRHAAASSIAQLPPATQTMLLDKMKTHSDYANLKSAIGLYLRGIAEEHFTQLLARFYSRDFTWITEELQYEIEALEEDRSKLLIAIWQEKPEETESIVEKWSQHQSEGLQKTARGFYRTMKKLHRK